MRTAIILLALATVACCLPAEIPNPDDVAEAVGGSGRIAGGQGAGRRQFTHVVQVRSLLRGELNFCGGSVISHYWVLTAAHCTHGRVQHNVRFQTQNANQGGSVQTSFLAVSHPEFDMRSLRHDISLVQMPRLFAFWDGLGYIRLPRMDQQSSSFVGGRTMAVGWGAVGPRQEMQGYLRWVFMRVITNEQCARTYGSENIADEMVCAEGFTDPSNQGVCYGDEGGPLMLEDQDGRWTLIGVTSFYYEGQAGCDGGRPSGFTRVSRYLPWIHRLTAIEPRN